MEEKKIVIASTPRTQIDWSKVDGVFPDDMELIVWDSCTALEGEHKSFEMIVTKTDEEMEAIREQEEKRNKARFNKMLSKPKRK